MWAVTEAMSPQETQFFRDSSPFAVVRDVMLPKLAGRAGDQPIRIWSGACATGQEIYSLAMIADEDRPKLGSTRVELFVSDLSEAALAKAQAGLYTQFEIQRGLPIKLLLRYFQREDEMWQVAPSLRQMIRWKRINLLADLTPLGQFDIVFCRYVTSYFDDATRARSATHRSRTGGAAGTVAARAAPSRPRFGGFASAPAGDRADVARTRRRSGRSARSRDCSRRASQYRSSRASSARRARHPPSLS